MKFDYSKQVVELTGAQLLLGFQPKIIVVAWNAVGRRCLCTPVQTKTRPHTEWGALRLVLISRHGRMSEREVGYNRSFQGWVFSGNRLQRCSSPRTRKQNITNQWSFCKMGTLASQREIGAWVWGACAKGHAGLGAGGCRPSQCGVQGYQPWKNFEILYAKSCNLVHFWPEKWTTKHFHDGNVVPEIPSINLQSHSVWWQRYITQHVHHNNTTQKYYKKPS